MIYSMTGFGEAQREVDGQVLHVEIRSFNQRYLKLSLHLPEDYAFLESEVERLLRARLTRGSVTLRLHVRALGSQAAMEINTAALAEYVRQLRVAAGDDAQTTIDLAALLVVPGVCQTPELTDAEREHRWRDLSALTGEALERLMQMRATEGEALAADVRAHCKLVQDALERIRGRAPLVITEYRDRLKARIDELIAGRGLRLAEEDLLKEVSIYAERSDISEEISRLAGHLEQFSAVMVSREAAGRKLEFIAQEMLREANTMGSKTGDVAIARDIIEIKTAIDRIKEQAANAE